MTPEQQVQIDATKLIQKLTAEITRLRNLCKDNGIDSTLPSPGATMSVGVDVKVFSTLEKAQEYEKNQD
jgi:hypothetical protein